MKKRTALPLLSILMLLCSVAFLGSPVDQAKPGDRSVPVKSDYPTPRAPHATITIASSLDWAAAASSGSGTAGNPWIIEDLDIDCAGVGSGISVTGTADHAIIRNCYMNDSGSAGADAGIIFLTTSNVLVTNCTFEYNNANVAMIMTSNCNITNSTLRHAFGGGYINLFMDDADNTFISGIESENGTTFIGRFVTAGNSENVTITDSAFQNASNIAYVDNIIIDSTWMNETLQLFHSENVTLESGAFSNTGSVMFDDLENVIVRNMTFDPTTPIAAIIAIAGASNNITIDNNSAHDIADFVHVDTVTNVNVSDNSIVDASYLVHANACENVTIANNVITNTVYGVLMSSDSGVNTIANNAITNATQYGIHVQSTPGIDILNNTIYSAGRGIYIDGGSDNAAIIGNDVRHMMINDAINVESSDSTYIAFNYVYCPGNSTNGGTPTAITLTNENDLLVENNTLEHANGTWDGYGVAVTGICTNITIRYNYILDCFFGVASFAGGTVVRYNWFRGNFNDFEEDVLGLTDFGYNYYYEYFTSFPYDVTLNTTSLELPHDYLAFHARSHYLDPPLYRNDTHPLYWAPWYPRTETVNLQFDSIVNGQEIPLGFLRVYLDGVLITTLSPEVHHVLYRVTVYDLNHHLYHDRIYNLNATGPYLAIVLHAVAQAFFSFFSSIDNFGLEWELVKLLVNGSRVTTSSPYMLSELSRVTIKDYANSIIYDQVLNLSITGVNLDLGLAITTITFFNNFSEPVIFYLMKGGVTTSFTIPRLSSITVRLAMGDYDYEITDLSGHQLETGSMKFASGDATSFFVVFGKVSVTPPGLLTGDATAALISVALIVGGVLAAVLVFSFIWSRRSGRAINSSKSVRSRKYKYIIT